MAKKKTAKKKAAQKKAVKKKAVKKQGGKKKGTKAHKKSGGKILAAAVSEITYKCASTCTASDRRAHMTPGSTVYLHALNTDVTIDFLHGSPFVPATNQIKLNQGDRLPFTVGNHGPNEVHFDYVLTCPGCKTSASNPEMIVP